MNKQKILKKLHSLLIDIVKADNAELNKIGVELTEIEKKLINYTSVSKETSISALRKDK